MQFARQSSRRQPTFKPVCLQASSEPARQLTLGAFFSAPLAADAEAEAEAEAEASAMALRSGRLISGHFFGGEGGAGAAPPAEAWASALACRGGGEEQAGHWQGEYLHGMEAGGSDMPHGVYWHARQVPCSRIATTKSAVPHDGGAGALR